jgi:hypothetical protein
VKAGFTYRKKTIDYPYGFIWVLCKEDALGNQLFDACYVCETARFHGMREEDCTTPVFELPDISEEALEYMHHFAQVFQAGYLAGLGSAKHGA